MSFKSSLFLAVASVLVSPPGVAAATASCGEDIPCEVKDGEYYIHLPETRREGQPLGAIFYLHGHRGKAVNAIRNKSFQRMADDLGVAFVAVQGINGTWSFPTAPRTLRDEATFFDGVLEDLSDRFGVDRDRTLLSGFSAGGFMTWYLACEKSDRFSGYAPIAGAFWEPLPQNCKTDNPFLFHVHGTTDTVVPLAGRWLGGGRWKQGDVFESFDVWRRQNGLAQQEPEKTTEGDLACERWVPKTGFLELCLHGGGHSVKADWIRRAWTKLGEMKGWIRS
ncbi:alpha/beta hydrolase family esterase [Roseibium aggregatum]|uniref:Polyhydroxybutyrate depolymerase n=1 Tax=Roseibium aggregatum TaxID=187304 RepID=A0A939J6M6_9HYPH|nr:alpha/beta hydrolase-fold protein [Roseibium aggregatum]MBN9672944.1 polyhydroxybutyrate depolymerase [Roseibium aggregatum]